MVPTDDNKLKCCAYCQFLSTRNKSGGLVRTRHKCEVCETPLCRGRFTDRDCFQLFHDMNFFIQFGLNIIEKQRCKKYKSSDSGFEKLY